MLLKLQIIKIKLLCKVRVIFENDVDLKGLVHSKMKISPCFTRPQGILGVYDFLLSDKSNQSYIENGPGSSKLYHCSQWVQRVTLHLLFSHLAEAFIQSDLQIRKSN